MCVSAGAVRFTAPPKPVRSKAWALLEGEQRGHLQMWNEDRKVCFAETLRWAVSVFVSGCVWQLEVIAAAV